MIASRRSSPAAPTPRARALRRLPTALFCFGLLVSLLSTVAAAQTSINVNGANGGRTFGGIGAISGGGGNSRLLYDYPSAQQSQILDYLFKPGVGASLQVLKVEIGGGADSTDGSESSIEPTQGNINCNTGYEWWLMGQAQARNPNIKFYALAWTAPGWIGGWYDTNAINYLVSWLSCAQSHGFTISYLGGLNEQEQFGDAAWWEQLRAALNSNGFSSTQLVIGDQWSQPWSIADSLLSDPNWAAAISVISAHYPCAGGDGGAALTCSTTVNALATGKPLWQGEGGSLDYDSGAPGVIRAVVRGYTDASFTAFINWPVIAALYPNLPFKSDGLIWADEPWSGWYSVGATNWVLAQVTQFTQPGWTFIDSASGYLNGNEQNGSFVTLKSPNGSDYSTILETTTATAAQTVNFIVAGGLSTGTVHVWATNLGSSSSSDWFVQQPDITPNGGAYSLTMQPNFVYSVTTISGQGKGAATSPAAADLSLPYSDSFAGYAIGSTAKYLAQLQGDFQSQPCVNKGGNCITQILSEAPSVFFYSNVGLPWAVLGDVNWSNYTVSVDALLEQSGTVYLAGLVNANSGTNSGTFPDYFDGYSFQISDTGAWILYDDRVAGPPTALASGSTSVPGLNTWFTLAMTLNGSSISASINGSRVASVNNSDHQSGQVGFGILGWQTGQFSNLSITPGPCTPTMITPYIQVSGQSWQQTASVTVGSGYTVNLGPQPLGVGSWIWTGPNGFTSTSREIDAIPLRTGVNTFVATYTNPGGCQSTQTFTITVTGNPAGYWLSAGTATPASVDPGGSSTISLTVTSANNYAGTVTLSCSISPAVTPAPICSFANTSPVTVTTAGGSATLIFTSIGPTLATFRHRNSFYALWLPVPGLALIGLGLGSGPSRRNKLLSRSLLWIALAGLIVLAGCGSGNGGRNSGTPAGTYTVTITGKDANNLSPSNPAPNVTVTVN